MARPTALAFAIAASFLSAPAFAGDAEDAQMVIESQINAFLTNDAETAYSFAAPGIKRMYPDAEMFMEMVRRGYGPVFKPGNFAFGKSRPSDDGSTFIQEVIIADPVGRDWKAVYVLERQPDGSFKINGVHMLSASAPQI